MGYHISYHPTEADARDDIEQIVATHGSRLIYAVSSPPNDDRFSWLVEARWNEPDAVGDVAHRLPATPVRVGAAILMTVMIVASCVAYSAGTVIEREACEARRSVAACNYTLAR